MALLIPLVIFLVMCILMIVFMGKSQAPGPVDTAEAFIDALLRNDKKTLESISNLKTIPADVIKNVKAIEKAHKTVATNYNMRTIKDTVNNDTSFYTLELRIEENNTNIEIQLVKNLNRWIISNVDVISISEKE